MLKSSKSLQFKRHEKLTEQSVNKPFKLVSRFNIRENLSKTFRLMHPNARPEEVRDGIYVYA